MLSHSYQPTSKCEKVTGREPAALTLDDCIQPETGIDIRYCGSGDSLIAQLVKNPPAICWRRGRLPTRVFLDFPCGSAGKESTRNAGDLGLILGLGKSPGEGKGYPLQYSGLENSVDCKVRGVTKSQTRLSDLHFHFHCGSGARTTGHTGCKRGREPGMEVRDGGSKTEGPPPGFPEHTVKLHRPRFRII